MNIIKLLYGSIVQFFVLIGHALELLNDFFN